MHTRNLFAFLILIISFTKTGLANELPEGFTEEVLQKVMDGQIVLEQKKNTENEYRAYHRAYFNKVSSDAFIKLAVNHPKYAALFEEVEDGRTLDSNKELTEFTYSMDLKIKMGFISFFLNGKGKHKVKYAPEAGAEAHVFNELTNHKDKVRTLTQSIRLIPYETGMLVEQELNLVMHDKATSKKTIKNYLRDFLSKYLRVFRTELKGN